ncbi:MAG: hypothetical protein FVQ81_07175 [Candidatus Glassbacteria bacterium]|nr:hypothetical protein [Candidatus Glassbacteria bacterium]
MKVSLPVNYKAALWIIAAGMALRLLVLALCLDTPLFGDAHAYHRFAMMYLNGESFDTVRAPGLSLWLAAWYGVFGAGQLSSMLSILPFHLILSAAIYYYSARLVNARAALIALALISFYPSFVFHSVWPLTQVPMAAALALTLYLLDSKPSPTHALAAGLLLGFAILLRPNCVILAPVLSLIILLRKNRRAFVSASVLLAVSLAPALLWSAREYRHSGNLVFINYTNSMNLYLGNNRFTPLYKTWWFGSHGQGARDVPAEFSDRLSAIREIPLSSRNKVYLKGAIDEITTRPGVFIVRTLSRIRTFFAFDTYTGTQVIKRFGHGKIVGASVLGLVMLFYLAIISACLLFYLGRGARENGSTIGAMIPAAAVAYAFPFWLAFSHPTYHLPLLPLLAIPTAAVLERLIRNPSCIREYFSRDGINYRLIIALAILLLIQLEWVLVMSASFYEAI